MTKDEIKECARETLVRFGPSYQYTTSQNSNKTQIYNMSLNDLVTELIKLVEEMDKIVTGEYN